MTDISKYRNVSLTHATYKTLQQLSKVLLEDTKLSISKTIEAIATYQGPGPTQGWYTDHGTLIYGFYCE